MKKWEVDEHEQWSEKVRSLHCLCSSTSHFIYFLFLSDERANAQKLLDYTIRIGSTPTFSLYFNILYHNGESLESLPCMVHMPCLVIVIV